MAYSYNHGFSQLEPQQHVAYCDACLFRAFDGPTMDVVADTQLGFSDLVPNSVKRAVGSRKDEHTPEDLLYFAQVTPEMLQGPNVLRTLMKTLKRLKQDKDETKFVKDIQSSTNYYRAIHELSLKTMTADARFSKEEDPDWWNQYHPSNLNWPRGTKWLLWPNGVPPPTKDRLRHFIRALRLPGWEKEMKEKQHV
jgi:hypothetical protein